MPVNPDTLEAAAQWIVRLDDQPTAQDREAFRAWLAAAPEHLQAFQRLQGALAPLQVLQQAPARSALSTLKHAGRKAKAARALALSVLLLVPVGLTLQQFPPSYLLADIRSGSGQWLSRQLPDGSLLKLDGHSAVDVQFDSNTRTLRLVQGEILVEVAKDPTRPFRVLTEHGSVQALGTRFVVERLPSSTRLAMLESSTAVDSAEQRRVVKAGEQLRFDANGPGALEAIDAAGVEQAWEHHQLLVREQPLAEVLERLARNHRGYLSFDRELLAGLKVTAVLPADDSPRALRLLARSLPIRIEQFTPWYTRVTLRSAEVR